MKEYSYLNAIPMAVIAVDRSLSIRFINQAAQILFETRNPALNDELCELCERVFVSGEEMTLFEYKLPLAHSVSMVNMHITPVVPEAPTNNLPKLEELLITIEKTDGLNRQTASGWKQEITRAAGVMAAMLAHEMKNPLSGIRGAAQILKDEVIPEHHELADLICMETDRIRDLLDQMEVFSFDAPIEKQPVNIHEVLRYVIAVAKNGFAPKVTFREQYDPSLPEVLGQRDMLVQMFLNLVKNAAEAMSGQKDATITLSTQYISGYRIRPPHAKESVALPIAVKIEDDGPGIPESIRDRLFEPFATSKQDGRGLGLAVVAKIASDLGVVVDLERETARGAAFTVHFPKA